MVVRETGSSKPKGSSMTDLDLDTLSQAYENFACCAGLDVRDYRAGIEFVRYTGLSLLFPSNVSPTKVFKLTNKAAARLIYMAGPNHEIIYRAYRAKRCGRLKDRPVLMFYRLAFATLLLYDWATDR